MSTLDCWNWPKVAPPTMKSYLCSTYGPLLLDYSSHDFLIVSWREDAHFSMKITLSCDWSIAVSFHLMHFGKKKIIIKDPLTCCCCEQHASSDDIKQLVLLGYMA